MEYHWKNLLATWGLEDVWWSRGNSISVEYWYWRRRYESPRCQKVFQWYSMTNIATYIINNELRYHCSINYITKIASVMMWELTLDEWEKTVLLNSWLDASFFGDVWRLRGYSISVDYWYRRRRYESPRGQKVFSMIFHDKYCYLYN